MRSNAFNFTFNGVNSDEYGLYNLSTSLGGGLNVDNFIGVRGIREDSIEGRDAPYYYGLKENPLSFTVNFGFIRNSNPDNIELGKILDWLIQDTYQPLIFSDNPDKIYYVIFTASPTFHNNGLNDGYISLNARCLYPYPVIKNTQTGVITVTTSGSVTIKNAGKKKVVPSMEITIASSGNNTINIKNMNNGSEFEFTADYNDVISVDGFNRIPTNVTNNIQFKPDKRWLEFDSGDNNLVITGDCSISFSFKSGTYA